ncbi:unnamed protein product [Cuscuta europaea]|uniref:Uncharacterized protein n=1 Tax=Cuscuta europaea TaxID=41803 RepID=A0A9P1EGR2_CUSEU|nr:unnamed protein product [Cuscuta europaea]
MQEYTFSSRFACSLLKKLVDLCWDIFYRECQS